MSEDERFLRSKYRLGNELLSPVLRQSIIAAEGLNGRVRDGIVCFTFAMITKPMLTSLIKKHVVSIVFC